TQKSYLKSSSPEDFFFLPRLAQIQNHLARFGRFPSEIVFLFFDRWQRLRHFANDEHRRRRQALLERQFFERGPMDLLFRESGIRHDHTRRRSIQSALQQFHRTTLEELALEEGLPAP